MRSIIFLALISAATAQLAGYLQAEEVTLDEPSPVSFPGFGASSGFGAGSGFGSGGRGGGRGLSAWQQRWSERFQREPNTLAAYRNRANRARPGGRLGQNGNDLNLGELNLGNVNLGSSPDFGSSFGGAGIDLGQSGIGLGQSTLGLGQRGLGLGSQAIGFGGSRLGAPSQGLKGIQGLQGLQGLPASGFGGLGQSAGSSFGQAGLGIGQAGLGLGQGVLGLGQSGLGLASSSASGLGNQWLQNLQQQRNSRMNKWRQNLSGRRSGSFPIPSGGFPSASSSLGALNLQQYGGASAVPLSGDSQFPGYPSPSDFTRSALREASSLDLQPSFQSQTLGASLGPSFGGRYNTPLSLGGGNNNNNGGGGGLWNRGNLRRSRSAYV